MYTNDFLTLISSHFATKVFYCSNGLAHWRRGLTDTHQHPQGEAAHHQLVHVVGTGSIDTAGQ